MANSKTESDAHFSPWLPAIAVLLMALAAVFGFIAGTTRPRGGTTPEVTLPLVIGVLVFVLLGSVSVALTIARAKIKKESIEDDANSVASVSAPDEMRAVFAETNQHLRNAEQKQLTITGAYLGMITVALSRFPLEKTRDITQFDQGRVAFVLAFLTVLGCCVFLLQAWCRVWKEHYLKVARRIANTWNLPEQVLPYWLRRDLRKAPDHAIFKANVDNTLMYLTFAMNAALVTLLSRQLLLVLDHSAANIAVAGVCTAYVIILWRIQVLVKNRRDILDA